MTTARRFRDKAGQKSASHRHRDTLRHNIGQYLRAVERNACWYPRLELQRRRNAHIRRTAVLKMSENLKNFGNNLISRGGEVHWADTVEEALHILRRILPEQRLTIVKGKSMISEELELNEALHIHEVYETDLGEFIVQQAGEKPYHILTPAMHKRRSDVAALYAQRFGLDKESTAEEITLYTRNFLREVFQRADVGITGANFLIASEGAVCLTENEGNIFMTLGFPRIHVVIAGIEKVIGTLEEWAEILPVLAYQGTGQRLSAFNHIVRGPRSLSEDNGPEQMHVILLNNHRTDLLADPECSVALSCIRCGACLNHCPVYRMIGGHAYEAVYSGPIGTVISPFLFGMRRFGHLSSACTLCGACERHCAVGIPLRDLILTLRRRRSGIVRRAGLRMASFGMSAKLHRRAGHRVLNAFVRPIVQKVWGKQRFFPKFDRY